MEVLFDSISQAAIELLVVIIGTLLSVALHKVKGYFDTLKKKDELGIIDLVTDIAVEYAEKELKGAKGIEKRDFAVEKALEILNQKGIKISEAEVVAGIENGVNKLKKNQ